MIDPSGGGIAKAAGELMKEMQKAQTDLQKLDQAQKPEAGSSNFQDAMQTQQTQQTNAVQAPQAANKTTEIAQSNNVLMQAKENAIQKPTTRVGAAQAAKESKLATMLEGLMGGQKKMDGIMKMALSGKKFSPSELIGMQAGVYKFSQELELTSKVVEKATSGIKQTMNTQV